MKIPITTKKPSKEPTGGKLSEREVSELHRRGIPTIGPSDRTPKEPSIFRKALDMIPFIGREESTMMRQQKAMEKERGIGKIRIPFAKEKTFNLQDIGVGVAPDQRFLANIAARAPELLGRIPTAAVNFFRKNIKAIKEPDPVGPVETKQFQTLLGLDVRRFGIDPDEVLQDTMSRAQKQFDEEKEKNPERGEYTNALMASAKTVVPDVLDVLIAFSLGKSVLKAGAKRLPDKLLFKIQKKRVNPSAITDVLIQGKPKMSSTGDYKIAKNFINKLGAKERGSLFKLARDYEKLGQAVPLPVSAKPTIIGKWAEATPRIIPELPPKFGGLLESGKVTGKYSSQAGFIDPSKMGKDMVKLANKAKNLTAFKKALTKKNLGILAAKGFSPGSFYKASQLGTEGKEGLKKAGLAKEPSKFVRKRENTLLKDKVKNISRGAREGNIATREQISEAQKELKKVIKDSPLSRADKETLTGRIVKIAERKDTQHALRKAANEVQDRINDIVEKRQIQTTKKEIKKELKTAKPKKGAKEALESQFGAQPTRELMSIRDGIELDKQRLSKFTTKKEKTAEAIKIKQESQQKIEQNIKDYGKINEQGVRLGQEIPEDVQRENALLSLRGIDAMNSEELHNALREIETIKAEGKLSRQIAAEAKRSELDRVKEVVKIDFSKGVPKKQIVGEEELSVNPILRVADGMDNVLLGYRNLVDKLTFSKDRRVLDWTIEQVHTGRTDYINTNAKLWNDVADTKDNLFNLEKKRQATKLAKQQEKIKEVWKGKNRWGEDVTIKLSEQESAYWVMQMRDPSSLPIFKNNMGFTDKMISAVKDSITPEMSDYVEYLVRDFFPKVREIANPAYVRRFGMDMPNNPRYAPRIPADVNLEQMNNILPGDQFPQHPSALPSFTKIRKGGAGIKKMAIDTIVKRHINQTSQFVSFDEATANLRSVFMDSDVKRTILKNHPKGRYDTLIKKIDDITRGGMATQMAIPAIDRAISNFSKATLRFPNVAPAVKQITSLPTFVKDMSYGQLAVGSARFTRNPVKWTRKLMESDILFHRVTRGFDRETALMFRPKDAHFTKKQELSFGEFLKKGIATPTRGGDMIPILPGGVARYTQTEKLLRGSKGMTNEAITKMQRKNNLTLTSDGKKALRGKGMSDIQIDKAAMRNTEITILDTQQSPNTEDMGRLQTANSTGKAITMYATTPIQYFREGTQIMRNMIRGKTPLKEGVRGLLALWWVAPSLFQFASDGFKWNSERQARALILGPLNYYPAVGNLMGTLYDAFTKGAKWKDTATDISPLFQIPMKAQSSLSSLHKAIFDEDLSEEEAREEYVEATMEALEGFSLSQGIPVSGYERTGKGTIDLFQGNTKDPRRLFWSEWALDQGKEDEEGFFKDTKFKFDRDIKLEDEESVKFKF